MSEEVDKIVRDAASNVACETKDVTSSEMLEKMKNYLLGLSKESDTSFINGLVKCKKTEVYQKWKM